MKPAAVLFWLLGVLAMAGASWGNAHWTHLSADRFLIVHGTTRYVLLRNVTWDLQDQSQAKSFRAWRTGAGLPNDLGALVDEAPPTQELKLGATVKLVPSSGSGVTIDAEDGINGPWNLDLDPTADGYQLEATDRSQLESFASTFHLKPPDLLIALSAAVGKVPEAGAWKTIVSRLQSGHDFYAILPSSSRLIWGKSSGSTETAPVPASSAKPKQTKQAEAPASTATPIPWMPILGGVGALLVLGVAFFAYRAFNNPRGRSLRPISAHEQELIEMVRQETESPRWKGSKDTEGFVVGRMMEAFQKMDGLQKEVQALSEFRKFQAQHKEHEAKMAGLNKQLVARAEEIQKLQTAVEEGRRAKEENRNLSATLAEANKLIDDLTEWFKELSAEIEEMGK